MDSKALQPADQVPVGRLLIEFRHQVLSLIPGRSSRPMVEAGSEGDESLRCEPIARPFEEIVQTPPRVEDEDAWPLAALRDRQIPRDFPLRALEVYHCHVSLTFARSAAESAQRLKCVGKRLV